MSNETEAEEQWKVLRDTLEYIRNDDEYQRALTAYDAALAENQRLRADAATLRALVSDLADTGECWYDHHGHCQEHGWFETDVQCPHARARKLWDADGNELPIVH